MGTRFINIGGRFEQWVVGYRRSDDPPTEQDEHPNAYYVNDATVTFELRDASGTAVSGGSGTCSYVAGSNGNYLGTIPDSVTSTLTENAKYTVAVIISEGGTVMARTFPEYVARKNRARECC